VTHKEKHMIVLAFRDCIEINQDLIEGGKRKKCKEFL
jgi:hypothetical protein